VPRLERFDRSCGLRPGEPVDLREVEPVRTQRDLEPGDLRIDGGLNRRSGRQRPGECDERNEAAHGEPHSASGRPFL